MNGDIFQNSIRVIPSFISSTPIDMLSIHRYMNILVTARFSFIVSLWDLYQVWIVEPQMSL